MNKKQKRVVVGISGGVDSAVSALMLKQQGYEVIGVFMQNWDSFVNNEYNHQNQDKCDAQIEYDDALMIAKKLKIKLHKVDFIKAYWDNVFINFIEQYKNGLTPNPDVLCNKYIKFGCFLDYCQKTFQCDFIATGHYAKIEHYNDYSLLKIPKDKTKDQTYFLCELNQKQIINVLFPLGDLLKSQVRQIAYNNDLLVWNKKDSTGICFVGKRNFKAFLSNYINIEPGNIIDYENKTIVGQHCGICFYTIGQNHNLSISGAKFKYYVIKKDLQNNVLYVVKKSNKDKYLISYACIVKNFNWITPIKNNDNLSVRFRHLQQLHPCKIELIDKNSVKILYTNGAYAVTCGQYAVVYENDICLGGGVISQVIEN